MVIIRKAVLADLDFLVKADLDNEGITSIFPTSLSAQELVEHRDKIANFITSENEAAWVCEDEISHRLAGTIMYCFRDRLHDEPTEANEFLFRFIDDDWLPADGRFCEVFNLWIDPSYRRQDLATRLKQHMEAEARSRGFKMIYTHTEERNQHVIALNQKLGYQEIRRGPIWDSIIRVSLVKTLEKTVA